MGKSSSAVIGFKYFMSILMGICRGPVDTLREIRVGGRKAWPEITKRLVSGGWTWVPNVSEVDGSEYVGGGMVWLPEVWEDVDAPDFATESGQIDINQPDLFGGDKKEGGIVGLADVMMGEQTQEVNPRIVEMESQEGPNPLVPAFRGVFTIFYHGLVCSMSPYPKPWEFRVQRVLKGWDDDDVFYPAVAKINLTVIQPTKKGGANVAHPIVAMNPAHIIWECITNRDWGRGLSSAFLDEASFTAAADTLHAEGFGLCIKWTRQNTVDAFVQIIIDHIGAMLYVDNLTGLLTLKLIRSDYDIEDLPVFTTSTGIVSVEDDDSSTSQMQINEIIVSFVDPIIGDDRQVRVHNIASIQTTGSAFSKTMDYPGIPTATLAARVAQRDLRVHGTPLRRLKVTMDRRGYQLQPGAVFVFNDELREIEGLVLRVGTVESTPEGRILLACVQDIFGLPAFAYIGSQGYPGIPGTDPVDVVYGTVAEASYMDAKSAMTVAEWDALTGDESFLMMIGARPASYAISYNMYTGNDDIGFMDRGMGVWTPAAKLTADVGEFEREWVIVGINMPSTVQPGNAIMVGDERVRIDEWDSETLTLMVSRGVGDTIPEKHYEDDVVWFFQNGFGRDPTVYAETEIITGKFLTNTASGRLHQSVATGYDTTMVNRIIRPYPPGFVRIGTDFFDVAAPATPDFTLTWKTRNRVLQADVLVPHLADDVTPETGQTDTVIVRATDGTAARTETGITAGEWEYTSGMWATDGSPDPLQIELFSERDGYESWKKYRIPMTFETPDTDPHEYWRILVTAVNGGTVVAIAEVEMRATVGGADQCTGGTASASSEFSGGTTAAKGFDNDPLTPNFWQSNTTFPQWLAYHFTSAVTVEEVAMTIREEEGQLESAPVNFQIQFSDDGIAWETAFFRFDIIDWVEGGTKRFAR